MTNITRSQHYVPRFYLCTWAKRNGKVEVKLGRDRIFSSAPEGIAQKSYFYQYPNLSCDEISFVYSWMESMRFSKDCIHKYITSCIIPNIICQKNDYDVEESNKIIAFLIDNSLINANDLFMYKYICARLRCNGNPSICNDCQIHKMIKEGGENVNSFVEESFFPYYKRCLKNDTSFVHEAEGFEVISCYMIHQLYRTPLYMNLICRSPDSRFDIEARKRIRSFLRFPIIIYIYNKILNEKNDYVLKFINNHTSEEFITGDQPIFNLCCEMVNNFPASLDLYFPLSPTMAVMLLKKEKITSYSFLDNTLTIEDVQYLNNRISSACISQIYASNRNVLQRYYAGMQRI